MELQAATVLLEEFGRVFWEAEFGWSKSLDVEFGNLPTGHLTQRMAHRAAHRFLLLDSLKHNVRRSFPDFVAKVKELDDADKEKKLMDQVCHCSGV